MNMLSARVFMLGRGQKHARGFVMLLLLFGLLAAIGGYSAVQLYGAQVASNSAATNEANKVKAFKLAKDALLSFLVQNGRFPCPADPQYASTLQGTPPLGSCGDAGKVAYGYLPWQTLGLDPLNNPDVCLWYAVSGRVKFLPRTVGVNNDEDGNFRIIDVNGLLLAGNKIATTSSDNAFVVLISPDLPITTNGYTQNRAVIRSNNYQPCVFPKGDLAAIAKEYLDKANVTFSGVTSTYSNAVIDTATTATAGSGSTIKTFIQGFAPSNTNNGYPVNDFNDRLDWISSAEYTKAISLYAANQAALALRRFYSPIAVDASNKGAAHYPYASLTSGGSCDSATPTLSGFYPIACLTSPAWTAYVGETDPDPTLSNLVADGWIPKIRYTLSPKCIVSSLGCSGKGALLSDGSNTNLHTIAAIAGRGAYFSTTPSSIPVSKAYTR